MSHRILAGRFSIEIENALIVSERPTFIQLARIILSYLTALQQFLTPQELSSHP